MVHDSDVLPGRKIVRPPPTLPEHLLLKRLAIVSGLLAAGIALAGILAARSGIVLVGSEIADNKTIAFSAALTWILLGSILAYNAARPPGRFAGMVMQAVLVLIAVAGAAEFLFSVFGSHTLIEEFFVSAGMAVLGPSSSPVSPAAAALAVPAALGLASLVRYPGTPGNRTKTGDIAGLFGLAISLISIIFVLSYAYGNPLLYGTEFIPVAFISALAAFFIGASLVATAGPGAIPVRYFIGNSTSARLMRVFVPLAAVIILSENLIFVGLSSWSTIRDAVLLSAIFVIFVFTTAFVVARVSGRMGRALEEAENELVRKNEDLGNMNEELTASEEELRQNIDELTSAEHALREANEHLEQRVAERTAQLEKALKDSGSERQRLYGVLETLPVYVCLLDAGYRVPFANKYFRETFGESQGRCCYDFLFNRTTPCETCETYTVMKTRAPHHWHWTGPNGRDYDIYDFPFIDTDGSFLILEMGIDITETNKAVAALQEARDLLEIRVQERTTELVQKNEELNAINEELTEVDEELIQNIEELTAREGELSKALTEKEVLLSEIHHRVKNNLAAFISLLSLEGSIEETPAGKTLKQDLQNRARSMALIHETLYRTNTFDQVNMDMYLTNLVHQIAKSVRTKKNIRIEVDAHGIMLDIQRATPAGLIINELVTNSFKYAFPESPDPVATRRTPPVISVSLSKQDGSHVMTVKDNGIGLPPEFDPRTTRTLGLKLVNFLSRHQMRAKVEVNSGNGTEYIFRFGE